MNEDNKLLKAHQVILSTASSKKKTEKAQKTAIEETQENQEEDQETQEDLQAKPGRKKTSRWTSLSTPRVGIQEVGAVIS